MDNKILWSPTQEQIESTQMFAFMRWVGERHSLAFSGYPSLYQWSIDHPESFWGDLADFLDIKTTTSPSVILEAAPDFLHSRWFIGCTLNYSENLLRYNDEQLAIKGFNEAGALETLTYAQLHQAVAGVQSQFRASGLQKGDRVAAIMPNIPATVIAMLAATAMG